VQPSGRLRDGAIVNWGENTAGGAWRISRTLFVCLGLFAASLLAPASASATFTQGEAWNNAAAVNGLDSGLELPEDAVAFPASGPASGVYVVDANGASVFDYTPDGQALGSGLDDGSIGFFGPENEYNFCGPMGVAVDPATGDLYVEDTLDNAVEEFDPSGDLLALDGTPNSDGCYGYGPRENGPVLRNGPGSYESPEYGAVYGGEVYVAGGGAITETPVGLASATTQFTLAAADPDPWAIAVDPNTGVLYVADQETNEVLEYSATGSYLGVFATGFGSHAFTGLQGIAVDPVAKVVYVADYDNSGENGVIDTFSETTGAPLQQLALAGYQPAGISVDPVSHELYVPVNSDESDTVLDYSYTPAPTCTPQPSDAAAVGQGTALALACTDAAGAPVSYAIASGPAHGTLSALDPSSGSVTYTPAPGYHGPDSFTFDGSSIDGTSQPVTVSLQDGACADETLATAYEAAQPVTLACSAAGAQYRIVSGPADGAVSNLNTSSGALIYTPDARFVGTDSFTYEALSASGQPTGTATVTLYVGTPLPPPVQGKSANIYFSYGSVFVYLPGQTTPIPLLAGMQVPLGSIIDATDGGVGIFVTINGQIQAADFWSGEFKLTQSADPHTVLSLLGHKIPTPRCAQHTHSFGGSFSLANVPGLAHSAALAQIAKKLHKGKPIRELWGSGHGNFTTVGNGSAAAVRGTEWAIFDYPDGTLTFDFTDSVSVQDFNLHKTIVITAGHYYFAALGGLKRCR
jgi:DNA-binding beta-propeller fold protein YncE